MISWRKTRATPGGLTSDQCCVSKKNAAFAGFIEHKLGPNMFLVTKELSEQTDSLK